MILMFELYTQPSYEVTGNMSRLVVKPLIGVIKYNEARMLITTSKESSKI